MKLFDGFEAVKFSEENVIFVTDNGYIYYICYLEDKYWRKHKNAGNDHITVSNYQEISKKRTYRCNAWRISQERNGFYEIVQSQPIMD